MLNAESSGAASKFQARPRWVWVASVKAGVFIRRREWGCPGGYWLNWRGKTNWAAPNQLLTFEEVVAVVRHRVRLAGLELLGLASDAGGREQEYRRLHALVRKC